MHVRQTRTSASAFSTQATPSATQGPNASQSGPGSSVVSTITSDRESDEQLKTQFLRRVAHDIASPTGVTLTVLEELATADRPRPELVAMARRSLKRLVRLSDHLALVAELEAGVIEPETDALDLRALVKQSLDEALAIDGRKDVSARLHAPEIPVHLTADSRLLSVVLREVIGNALKLATSAVAVTVGITDGSLTVRVEDDGPGFSEDAKGLLGRRFVRRSSQRGLGLSLSMGIEVVHAHGGEITFGESSLPPGRQGKIGAAVTIHLPEGGIDPRAVDG